MRQNKPIENPICADEVRDIIGITEEIQSDPNQYKYPIDVKFGFVTDCEKLNVRKKPNIDSEVLFELPRLTEVVIDETKSTEEFYKICEVSGMEGFCMKRYISVQR